MNTTQTRTRRTLTREQRNVTPFLLEARCRDCDGTFTPADRYDMIHDECGGTGVVVGTYR